MHHTKIDSTRQKKSIERLWVIQWRWCLVYLARECALSATEAIDIRQMIRQQLRREAVSFLLAVNYVWKIPQCLVLCVLAVVAVSVATIKLRITVALFIHSMVGIEQIHLLNMKLTIAEHILTVFWRTYLQNVVDWMYHCNGIVM